MKSRKFALASFALAPILALTLPEVARAHDHQSGPVAAAGNTLLAISAEGRSTRTPDLAVFSAGVTTQGKTAGAAMTANAAAMSKVLAELKKAGIADKDIQTSSINLNPVYGQPVLDPQSQIVQEPRIIGYQANNMLTVKQRDLKGFGKVLDVLVAAGANQISGPSFQMDKPETALDEARINAMKAARARADLYAKAAGLRVVRILTIAEGGGYLPPMPVMYAKAEMGGDAASTPIAAGQVEAQVSVNLQFELAP